MSNQFLKLRRSAVPGRIPSTSSLDFGEIALNTYDGLAFIKKSGSAGEQVVTIGITSGSFTGSFLGNLTGTASYATTASHALNLQNSNQITTGSITAIVNINSDNLFLIKSGSVQYFNISSSSNTTINSNLFIIRNFITQQPVLTVSQSIVQFATQSYEPTGSIENGSIWFTSTNFYVGLD
jgi:hypothetical protein